MADGLHHAKLLLSLAKGMARVARLCQREAAAKAGEVMRRRDDRVQMPHRWHRGCFVDYCSTLTRVLCVLFCLLQKCLVVVVLWAMGQHTHRTARPTHTLHIAPRWRRLTAFAWLPYSIEPTHLAAAAEQQQQQQHL